MTGDMFERAVVPLADPDDAADTARALKQFVHTDSEVIVVHVVEKGEGVPDKASVEQRERFAEDAYEAFLRIIAAKDGPSIRFATFYGRSVTNAILDGIRDVEASCIAFVPRGGSRWITYLTGSTALDLIEHSHVPVIALPKGEQRVVIERGSTAQ